ncbi:hypothetical protein [Cellulomonas sp.]|uniref:hypothetical protein n=1 Tax=Cellulomonas sp. TaxID=40001 RepID=UPI003BAA14FA
MPDDSPVGAHEPGAASGAVPVGAGAADQLGWPAGCPGRLVAGAGAADGVGCQAAGAEAAGCCCHGAGWAVGGGTAAG